MTTEEKIEVIRAFDEGKDVEYYTYPYNGEWCRKTKNTWDFEHCKYRIKPKTTRLDVANEFWEKTFGIKNAYNECSCINDNISCCECVIYKDGVCKSEKWWNTPYEEPKGE